jgi:hypothetical protein
MAEPTKLDDVDFHGCLSILQGWIGQRVAVGIDVTEQPLQVAGMRGVLAAAADIATPFDLDEYEFRVGEDATFAIHRSYFARADLLRDTTLIIQITDKPADEDPRAMTLVHVVQQ